MVDAVVGVRLKVTGVEETKAAMQEMRAQILGVSSDKLADAKATRELSRDARVLNNDWRAQTQILLAQHPALNAVNRAISASGQVFRAAATAQGLMNLANIAL